MRRLALLSVLVPAVFLAGCGTDTILSPTTPSIAPSLKPGVDGNFTYTTFDVPGATLTAAQGINPRGDIVGFADVGGQRHGFLLRDGEFTTIDFPGAFGTDARGISPDGDIVGGYSLPGEPAVNIHGYRLTKHGEFERVDYPGHTNTIPQRILPDGTILGCRHDENTMSTMRGIVIARSGSWELEQSATMNNGATPSGRLIVGLWTSMQGRGEGYVVEDGVFTPFIVPGSTFTAAWDVNPASEIVGVYRDASGLVHGFLRRGDDYATLDVPGATATRAFGINPRGDVVGNFTAGGSTHAFLATRER